MSDITTHERVHLNALMRSAEMGAVREVRGGGVQRNDVGWKNPSEAVS